jgi:hypothetical protein
MPKVYKTAATLRFRGDDLDPIDLSRALGTEPTLGAKKGGVIILPKGRAIVAKSGMWHLKTDDVTPGDIDSQITALFSSLSNDLTQWRDCADRYDGNIFVGIFLSQLNEGLSISSETLSAIGARGLELGLDIYGHHDRGDGICIESP